MTQRNASTEATQQEEHRVAQLKPSSNTLEWNPTRTVRIWRWDSTFNHLLTRKLHLGTLTHTEPAGSYSTATSYVLPVYSPLHLSNTRLSVTVRPVYIFYLSISIYSVSIRISDPLMSHKQGSICATAAKGQNIKKRNNNNSKKNKQYN